MGNTPKITRITIDNVKYDIDLPSDASPVIDSLEVTRQLIVPVIDNSSANNTAANKGYVDALQKRIDTIKAGEDVVDVVGTKAELDSYDTSKLTNGDVVKVLTDETSNNITTYYRWTNSSWTFVGQADHYVRTLNEGNKVYIHNGEEQTDLAYTKDATVNTIVERTTNGNINLPSDVSKINSDSYAASKKYVDNAVTNVNNNLTRHINDQNNPHAVNKSQVGLSHVVNTGDSSEPVSNGTDKFTTGGAFALKTSLEAKINNLSTDNIVSGLLPDERIASAETWNTQINTLTENVTTNTSQLTEIETNISSINTEIGALKNTIGDISSILDEINGEVI